jgi:hypothetical protein
MSETKPETIKAINIKVSSQETLEKLNRLNTEGKSNPEFLAELLDCYEKFKGKDCSTTPKEYFQNILGVGANLEERQQNKKDKERVFREVFDLQPNDPLEMSECELLETASKCSGKTIEQMAIEGRELVAKNEIGRHVQSKLGMGRKGAGDEKIAQTYEYLKQSGQKQSLNRLTQLSGSNRKTVESWCERNKITFE